MPTLPPLQAVHFSDSDVIPLLDKLIQEFRDELRVEMAFVVHVMKPLYDAITALQK